MSGAVFIRNRQHAGAVDLRQLRRLVRALLTDFLRREDFDLGIYLVGAPEMTRLNETFLHHAGSTDVIAFGYSTDEGRGSRVEGRVNCAARKPETRNPKPETSLHGEIFICIDAAIAQARRFRTIWQSELARYVVHGILHLSGYDDRQPAARRRMKKTEDRLLRQLGHRFILRQLARRPQAVR